MRLGIFVVMAGRNAGGPETYEHALVRSLPALDGDNEYHVFCLSRAAADSFAVTHDNLHYHLLWSSVRWVSVPVSLPLSLLTANVDMLHATYVPPPLCPRPYVFTLLDISMFTHPEFYPSAIGWRLRRLVRRGLQQARLIICISRHTQAMVAETFKIPSERLVTIPLGVGDRFRPIAPASARPLLAQKYNIGHRYVLFVGALIPRKNVFRVLDAFDRVRQDSPYDLKLVLAGRKTWAAAEVDALIARRNLRDVVIELSYFPDVDLPVLYSAAEMLLFPSLDEGFGLPVLEAMACGTPVLTSNVSALPEVAGDAALLVDPYSVDDIASKMRALLEDSALRASLRAKGLARAPLFSWECNARATLAAYRHAYLQGR